MTNRNQALPDMVSGTGAMERNYLRNTVRNHADRAERESVLAGRRVSDLRMEELDDALQTLGYDPEVLRADYRAGRLPPAPPVPAVPAVSTSATTTLEPPAVSPPVPVTPDALPMTDPVEAEVSAVRSLIMTGGFSALDTRLRELVQAANRPPVEIERIVEVERIVERMVEVPAAPVSRDGKTIPQAKPSGQTITWRKAFSVSGAMGSEKAQLWDGAHPDTPVPNARYVWPSPITAIALTQIKRTRNVLLYGPAGTGKTEWAIQLAATLGRPFALISCDAGTDAATLVGMTVPSPDGGTTWQDGQLTRAIQTPGCVVLIDEPSVARPGALFVLQNVLANRTLFLAETGRRVPVAPGVIFLAADNTNGTGGGSRRGYTDTNRLNAAFLDRFGAKLKFDFLPQEQEAGLLVSYTGCTSALARLLVGAARTTRATADNQGLTAGIGLRRLLSWAEMLTDGVDAEAAFHAAVLNGAPDNDTETLRQQCILTYDANTVRTALQDPATATDTTTTTTTTTTTDAAASSAAADFTPVRS